MITRLREGERPRFPPSRRDAVILGGTVFDLLDRHRGHEACSMLAARTRREGAESSLEMAFEARIGEIERGWRRHLDEIVYPQGAEGVDPLADTGERPSPLDQPAPLIGEEKPSPLRLPREEPVDLHNLELETDERVDFDPDFEDPFEGEPRISRGSGLRDPTRSELGPPPDLDFGSPPEFGFESLRWRPGRGPRRAPARARRRPRSRAQAAPGIRFPAVSPARPRRSAGRRR